MSKIKIAGNAMVLISTISTEDMDLMNNKVVLKDREGSEAYTLVYKPGAEVGSINDFSATFNSKTRAGKLQLTIIVKDAEVSALKRAYGDAIAALNEAESVVANVIAERRSVVDAAFADIEIDDATPAPATEEVVENV